MCYQFHNRRESNCIAVGCDFGGLSAIDPSPSACLMRHALRGRGFSVCMGGSDVKVEWPPLLWMW